MRILWLSKLSMKSLEKSSGHCVLSWNPIVKKLLGVVIVMAWLGLLGCGGGIDGEETAILPGNSSDLCLVDSFVTAVLVFPANDLSHMRRGTLTICAVSGVPSNKIEHAARVAAQWLDNDQDGSIDNTNVAMNLLSNRATVFLLQTASQEEFIENQLAAKYSDPDNLGVMFQTLYATETHLISTLAERDASGEEIHHILSDSGWENVGNFSQRLDAAYNEATNSTPSLWVYNDPTCNRECQKTEFLYTSVAAYLGSEPDLQANELKIPAADRTGQASAQAWLNANLEQIYNLIHTTTGYPNQIWPNGQYPHTQNIVIESTSP
ncbi:hypothetical protein COTS27_00732 [Spirochaetota bacterium]|nr:hypothetical protein COTS27_00732 [Spirochaetota bacterium]